MSFGSTVKSSKKFFLWFGRAICIGFSTIRNFSCKRKLARNSFNHLEWPPTPATSLLYAFRAFQVFGFYHLHQKVVPPRMKFITIQFQNHIPNAVLIIWFCFVLKHKETSAFLGFSNVSEKDGNYCKDNILKMESSPNSKRICVIWQISQMSLSF